MYKLYCDECENRFTITDEQLTLFIEDGNTLMMCPKCNSIEVHLLEVEGQNVGY